MPVFKEQIESGPVSPDVMVRCKVREEGHGKISTGTHDPRAGEEFFAEGEEFEVAEPQAKQLKAKYYVDFVKAAKV